MATFNGIDYAIFVLLFLSVAIGIARGFVKEIISLLAWIAAFLISTLYCVKVAVLFSGVKVAPGTNPIEAVSMVAIVVSYLVLFVGVLLCGSIVKMIANYVVQGSGLTVVNRLFGSVFGLARGCLIVLLCLFFLSFTALSTHSLWKDSKLIAVFQPGVKRLNHLVQPYLTAIQAKMKKTAKDVNQQDLSDVIKVKPQSSQPTEVVVPEAPAPSMSEAPPAAEAPPQPLKVPTPSPVPVDNTAAPVTTPPPPTP